MMEYHKLRPRQAAARKQQLPVAYVGCGVLEWHGLHNPLGLDGEKAHGIACLLAERLGGVAMPPLYWGDNRRNIVELRLDPGMPDNRAGGFDHAAEICRVMGFNQAAIRADGERSLRSGGWSLWEQLVTHMLFQIETLGFRLIVPIPGHYPLFGPLDRAISSYRRQGGASDVFVLKDPMFAPDGKAGDHGAAFETSLMMALDPQLVDLAELPAGAEQPVVGVVGDDPRTHAGPEFGNRILDVFISIVRQKIAETKLWE